MSDQTHVEQILTIKNGGAVSKSYTAKFFHGTNNEANKTYEQTYTLGAESFVVARTVLDTSTLGYGDQELLYELYADGVLVKSGSETVNIVSSSTKSVPVINSSFLDPLAFRSGLYPAQRPITQQDVADKVNAMNAAGIKTIIITYPEYICIGRGAYYPTAIPELLSQPNALGFDFIGTVMGQAEANGQKVIMGIGRGNDPELTYNGCDDPVRLSDAISLAENVIDELADLYASSPSFYGWYITHEAGDIDYAKPYYNYIADYCHNITPDKPVAIAPDGNASASSAIISGSHCDIFIYQDAVGAGYVPYEYTWDPDQRIAMLDSLFATYASWHTIPSKHIWADLEAWQMDGPEYTGAYPADWSRVSQQLEILKQHVGSICLYDFGGFMETPESTAQLGGPKAVTLYNDYLDYLDTL